MSYRENISRVWARADAIDRAEGLVAYRRYPGNHWRCTMDVSTLRPYRISS